MSENEERTTRWVSIDNATKEDAEAIERGLAEPEVRAFVLIVGVLMRLPSDRSRARTLRYVKDRVDEGI